MCVLAYRCLMQWLIGIGIPHSGNMTSMFFSPHGPCQSQPSWFWCAVQTHTNFCKHSITAWELAWQVSSSHLCSSKGSWRTTGERTASNKAGSCWSYGCVSVPVNHIQNLSAWKQTINYVLPMLKSRKINVMDIHVENIDLILKWPIL